MGVTPVGTAVSLFRRAARLLGAVALAAGLFLAAHHPLSPWVASLAFTGWVLAALRWPKAWLFMLPACLPWLNFSPWTGWIGFEEFDLLVLGAVAAGQLRPAPPSRAGSSEMPGVHLRRWSNAVSVFALSFGAVSFVALWRGLADAGNWHLGWFQAYADPLNSVRLFKPVAYALALWPMTLSEMRETGQQASQRVAAGMVAGLACVSLIALWERAAYPGLMNVGAHYRITAAFWEMHVGGAALDAYLALAAPFAVWALWRAKGVWPWAGAALLAMLVTHAVLTTYSRGVYLGVGLPLLMLCLWFLVRRRRLRSDPLAPAQRWRTAATALLGIVLLTEAVLVLGPDSFMRERVSGSERDFGNRLAHWRSGLSLLNSPLDAALGIGLGRLPAHYAALGPAHEFSGAVTAGAEGVGTPGAQLRGPVSAERLEGLFGLTQRVPLGDGGPYRVSFDGRAWQAAEIDLFVCEMHLLYPQDCQSAHVRLAADPTGWQRVAATLQGPRLGRSDWFAPRGGVFWLSVATAGARVDVDRLSIVNAAGGEMLSNRRFGEGLAHWFPVALDYFLPWHIDNLWFELLIERGVIGLTCFAGLIVCVFFGLACSKKSSQVVVPFIVASLGGALLVGSVSSLMDVPRTALLLLWWPLLMASSLSNSEAVDAP